MSTARELLVGLHGLGAGRRLKVAIGPAERPLLSEVHAARLPMHTGDAWRRFVYPGLDAGSWALGTSDHPVWLVDIGASPGSAPKPPPARVDRNLDIQWFKPRPWKSEEPVHRAHASKDDGETTLCDIRINSRWMAARPSRASLCRHCYRAAYGTLQPQWPADRTKHDEAGRAFGEALAALTDQPLWIPCVDEIELPNERLGDSRLLDAPPDGWPGRRRDLHGAPLRDLRVLHRSVGAWERGIAWGRSKGEQAYRRTADRVLASRFRFPG